MRILHWYPNFLGGGGVSNAVLGLAKAQADLGVDVAIASAEPEGQPLYQRMQAPDGVRLFSWKPKWKVRAGSLILQGIPKEMQKAIWDYAPDVVHIHGEFNLENLWVLRLFYNARFILSPHGAFHPVVLRKSHARLKRMYIGLAKRLLYSHVVAFHALSPAEAEHIQSVLGALRVYAVPQGASVFVQIGPDNASDSPLQKRHDGEIRLIFVGRLDIYTKGLDILLEAFADAVSAVDKPLSLTLVGPDWKGSIDLLKREIMKLGIDEKVHLTGSVSGHKVRQLLIGSDLYLHFSRHEGFPLALTEALLVGKPAIVSDRVGTVSYREIANLPFIKLVAPDRHRATSVIVEAVRQLPELRKAAQECSETVRKFFDWHEIARRHIEFYAACAK
jgi:glycosyltransferase involved in cell wall biosynthesis